MSASKYAILGDVHGNLEALTAVIEDAERQNVDRFLCVGDLVGYNADPAECLDRIRSLKCVVVRGNHDHYCANEESLEDFHPLAASVIDWTRRQLSKSQIEFLGGLPLQKLVDGFTLVHSTLDMPAKWGYVFDALQADAHFNYQHTSVCFYGHTHLPVVFEKSARVTTRGFTKLRVEIGKKYFINTGSVGQPRDGDFRSAYVLYNMDGREIELRRVPYDMERTQDKIRKAGLPERLATRLEHGK